MANQDIANQDIKEIVKETVCAGGTTRDDRRKLLLWRQSGQSRLRRSHHIEPL